jgi:hypothetical protein
MLNKQKLQAMLMRKTPLTMAHDKGVQVAGNIPTPGAPNKYFIKPGK